jgi:anti-anti-sigma regulatory factor
MVTKRYFKCEYINGNCIVYWNESCLIGDTIAEIAGAELSNIVRSDNPLIVVMDFSNVNGISSSVIGCLIKVQKQLRRNGGQLKFIAVSPTMLGIFRTLNLLGTQFVVVADLSTALQRASRRLDAESQIRMEELV